MKHRLSDVFGTTTPYTRMWQGECYRLPGHEHDVAEKIPPPWTTHRAKDPR